MPKGIYIRTEVHNRNSSLSKKGQVSWCKGLTKEAYPRLAQSKKTREQIGQTLAKRFALGDLEPWNKGLRKESDGRIAKQALVLAGIPLSKEHCRNISLGRIGIVFSEEHCRNMGHRHTFETKQKIRRARIDYMKNNSGPWKDTKIELALQEGLTNLGIDFETQKCELEGTPDIFIAPNTCIFVDGDYWHNRPGAQEKDEKVTRGLRVQGYNVFRFWEHEINNDIGQCLEQLWIGAKNAPKDRSSHKFES